MRALLQVEWLKLRKTHIIPFLLLGPLIVFAIALGINVNIEDVEGHKYEFVAMNANFFYGVIFLPLMSGILAALICRYEHQAGGWKLLFALPTSRGKVFAAKFIIVSLLIFMMQVLVIAGVWGAGLIREFAEPFPMELILRGMLGGWVATFPLIALMLFLSTWFQSIAAPFAVNVIFTVPLMLVLNSSKVAPFYPWAQPFLMMMVDNNPEGIFYAPLGQLIAVIGGSFVLFSVIGYMYMKRKEV